MIKKGKKRKIDLTPYYQVLELENIIESMGAALRNAHVPYVAAYGRPTLSMETALMRFYDWARRANGQKA